MQKFPPGDLRPGDRVRVRRQRWTVVATELHDQSQLITLTGIGPANAGSERRLVAPFERFEPLEGRLRLRSAGARAWQRSIRTAVTLPGSPTDLRFAARASIDLMPYQLEPALALRKGLATRVLLADEVGLGKTVQAGLALAELQECGAVARALVLTPAGLRDQWAEELAQRFGRQAVVMDARELRHRAAALPAGVNPWSTLGLAIASLDFVKRPEVLPALLAAPWDAIVVDEAHGLSATSERGDAASLLCRSASYVLLLTATPHSGDANAFVSLCRTGAQLTPDLKVGPTGDRILAFRRTRKEVAPGPARRIHRLVVHLSDEERRMHQLLARLVHLVRQEQHPPDRGHSLALMVLQKRAFSCAHSLHQSILRRLAVLQAPAPVPLEQLTLPLDDNSGETDSADEPPGMTLPLLADGARERTALQQIEEAARRAMRRETKLTTLNRLISKLRHRDETAIVFTEYRDTLLRIQQALPCPSVLLHGGLNRQERHAAIQAFERGEPGLLLATDAAGEGLNLQRRCRLVINLELPWNPTRLEQRIGRVDRIGQSRRVHAVHLVAGATGEMRILDRLKARMAKARAEAGAADPLGFSADNDGQADGSQADESVVSFATLRAEATAEHARLTRVRQCGISPSPVRSTDVSLSRPRSRVLRALLGQRVLVLMQTDCEDGCGRVVASHISPLLLSVECPDVGSGFSRICGRSFVGSGFSRNFNETLLSSLRALDLERIDPSLFHWQQQTLSACSAFWTTRLAREEGILRELDGSHESLFQPGLFDRRSERDRELAARGRTSLESELASRLSGVQLASSCRIRSAQPILVLLPRHHTRRPDLQVGRLR